MKNKIAILPAVSWSTTVSPFLQLGYKVVLCDCDPVNLGLDINQLEKICKKYKPGLVVVVNVLGHSNNFKEINRIQKKYKFKIMEDNCESMGSKNKIKSLDVMVFHLLTLFIMGIIYQLLKEVLYQQIIINFII